MKTKLLISVWLPLAMLASAYLGYRAGRMRQPDYHVAEFRRKHPSESSHYPLIQPAHREIFRLPYLFYPAEFNATLRQILDRVEPESRAAALVARHKKANEETLSRNIEDFSKIKEAVRDGGHVFQYEFVDGDNEESGLMVLKAGDITFKLPMLFEAPETRPR